MYVAAELAIESVAFAYTVPVPFEATVQPAKLKPDLVIVPFAAMERELPYAKLPAVATVPASEPLPLYVTV